MRGWFKFKNWLKLLGLVIFLAALGVAVWQVQLVQILFPKARGVPANIVVDTQAILGPMPMPWRNLAQGGEETNNMLANVVDQVKLLRPEYIRIDHVYDFYEVVGRGADGKLTFDWSRLDAVVDSILATGAKPFLSLSYMPAAISSGDNTAPPRDYGEWSTVVQRTIEHFSGRNQRNIADIYYEVWNEPDLFGGWRTYGERNYLDLYRAAAEAAARASNVQRFKIGGPAITGQYEAWFDNLMKLVEKNNLRLDFFSWHRYSRAIARFVRDGEDIHNWLERYPRQMLTTELIITEWGHESEMDAGYDGRYSAAHTVAAAIKMMGKIDRAFIFEIKDGPDPEGKQFWGRWGLLTHEKAGLVQKARYTALRMLNSLSNDRLSLTGEGTWVKGVAAKKGETTQVILANYDPEGKHQEQVPVTFTNLKERSFTLETTVLGGKNDSKKVATTAAQLREEVLMPIESVVLLELVPE